MGARLIVALLALLVLGFTLPRSLWAQGSLENPQPGSFQSGIGLISGWACDASQIDIVIDDAATIQAAYGTERGDTLSVCADTDNGFGLLFNWNLLGDGAHTVRALADGVEFGSATFTVTTLGVEFLSGVSGECTLADFPQAGTHTLIQWQENLQNFVIVGVEGDVDDETPTLSVSPISLDFGEVKIGRSADLTFTVTNSGGGTLTGRATTSFTSFPFSIVSGEDFNLGAGASQTVTVRFSPPQEGSFSGSVNVSSSRGSASVSLSGTSTLPPTLSVSPTSLDFSCVKIGRNEDLTFTVTNSGGGTLTGRAITSPPFSIVSGDFFSLEAKTSQKVTVRLSAEEDSLGSVSGKVNLSSNRGKASVDLSGKVREDCSIFIPFVP